MGMGARRYFCIVGRSQPPPHPGPLPRWGRGRKTRGFGRLGDFDLMKLRFYLFGAGVLPLVAGLLLLAGCATSPKNPADLVDVQRVIPNIVLDIRYATTNNFTGQTLYPVARCCLRREAADRLREVQVQLKPLGLKLKVFDGYRPLSVQKKMWEVYPHEGFVADPAKGSRHNRGAAVDLTLIKLDGTEVPMPTPI